MQFSKFVLPLVLSTALAGKASAQSLAAEKPPAAPSIMTRTLREALDTTVSPCDDFDQFANGGWKAKHKNLPKAFGAFQHVMRHTDDRLLVILEAARKAAPTTTDPTTKVLGTFYASCLAADSVETVLPLTPGGVVPDGRQAQCLSSTDRLLRPALGQAFWKALMSPEIRAHTQEWLATIPAAIRTQIEQLTWLEDSVKNNALTALGKIDVRVSTAPATADYSGFKLSPTNYEENKKQIPIFEQERIAKLPKDAPRIGYERGPYYLDAFADPRSQRIVVATALFQQPFFDLNAEPAANYAAIGMVVGHELWHLLTPYFRWMDTEKGRQRASKVADQYSKFGDSGWSTVNEDLGDLGGVLATHSAWMKHGRKTEKPKIDGFTPEQRFFLYYARLWRGSYSSSQDNKHSGIRARINGVVMQIPAFGKAFGCKEGDPMFLAADRRADIFH